MTKEKCIAVMQPYFLPYAGYFRLLTHADQFVIFDCVQFPRRGRVHRTELPTVADEPSWLTLPLKRVPRETCIKDMKFADDATLTFGGRLGKLEWLTSANGPLAADLNHLLRMPLEGSLVDYLAYTLTALVSILGIEAKISRSSELGLDQSLKGPDRVITVAKHLGATEYLNSPGGRTLYSEKKFAQADLKLKFLPPYIGAHRYLLYSLAHEKPEALRKEISKT